jgi:Uma2 family endonuclease
MPAAASLIVSTSPLVKTYTLEEFWELPEPADHSKYELISGVLYMAPPPEYRHDSIAAKLNRLLMRHLFSIGDRGDLYIARAAIWTSPNNYLEPDLFYVSSELRETFENNRRTSADLAIEILSPGTALYDRNTKADTYGALGVRELWLVDGVAQTIEIRYQTGGGFGEREVFSETETVVSRVFPTLALPVSQIFE